MSLYDYNLVSESIIGRVAIQLEEANLMQNILRSQDGTHVEIGTLWGATAILASLAKRSGEVITIDYMKLGFWDDGDPEVNFLCPSRDILDTNISRITGGVPIKIVQDSSYPWPLPKSLRPTTVLIDGDHDYEGCINDWNSVKDITQNYIFIHDFNMIHSGVIKAVKEVIFKDPNWKLDDLKKTMVLLKRVR